ncbi:MAG: hypothetical protein IJR92_02000 [Alphaproteobacteria bacterium]|nr:hypothetical protein [Alphaproteobacteria bacterium]
MKRFFRYFLGFLTLVTTFVMLYVASAIYNASTHVTTEPYFFRRSYLAKYQTNTPKPLSEIGERKLLDWLLQKYVVEFFYVIPSKDNIENRTVRNQYKSPIYAMSSSAVFGYWLKNVAPKLQDMAEHGVLQQVNVFDEIYKSPNSDYWQVEYELKTWYKPNDMSENPTITRGTMYIRVNGYTGQIYDQLDEVRQALNNGIDPSLVFPFVVDGIQDLTEKN